MSRSRRWNKITQGKETIDASTRKCKLDWRNFHRWEIITIRGDSLNAVWMHNVSPLKNLRNCSQGLPKLPRRSESWSPSFGHHLFAPSSLCSQNGRRTLLRWATNQQCYFLCLAQKTSVLTLFKNKFQFKWIFFWSEMERQVCQKKKKRKSSTQWVVLRNIHFMCWDLSNDDDDEASFLVGGRGQNYGMTQCHQFNQRRKGRQAEAACQQCWPCWLWVNEAWSEQWCGHARHSFETREATLLCNYFLTYMLLRKSEFNQAGSLVWCEEMTVHAMSGDHTEWNRMKEEKSSSSGGKGQSWEQETGDGGSDLLSANVHVEITAVWP